ncbi:hypothetical protein AKG34_21445 [Peribacillus butanolivorans]|uniref:hypothetical protein n=1 Tax=Peribacillus butanolivorans TaxID=421767 RepID=UPI0006A73203|nr:hypothetical protein [Peribacillus butanolivorans]KON67386.1 hypothetical protein AKG34_21445 [Peribacillus butanolivorans]
MNQNVMGDLNKELNKVMLRIRQSLDVFGKINASFENSIENIVQMIIEKQRQEIEGIEDWTDQEIKQELKEDLNELIEHIRKCKVITKRLGENFKVDIEKDKLRIESKKNLETLVIQNNILIQSLISEAVADLDDLADEYKFNKDLKTESSIKKLKMELEELIERNFEVGAYLDMHFDWDLEEDIEIDYEELKNIFEDGKQKVPERER